VIRTIGPGFGRQRSRLIAGGERCYFAFSPAVTHLLPSAASLVPLNSVLSGLLILRGIGIELSTHIDRTVWRGFFLRCCFSLSSILLAIFFGAARGQVVRVSSIQMGYFFLPLWNSTGARAAERGS